MVWILERQEPILHAYWLDFMVLDGLLVKVVGGNGATNENAHRVRANVSTFPIPFLGIPCKTSASFWLIGLIRWGLDRRRGWFIK